VHQQAVATPVTSQMCWVLAAEQASGRKMGWNQGAIKNTVVGVSRYIKAV